ncbi:MAG: hydantoinase B/oxoprolinase family protein, partial [Isosphaeraceae bacterium]
ELHAYSESWMRRQIAALPDGVYSAEDCQEDDGFLDRPYYIRADVTIDGDRILVDYGRSDAQAIGPINSPYLVTASATYSAIFFVIGGDVLFAGSIGRTDLGGDYEQLMSGIFAKLLNLPDQTKVYPGHGPATTIGQEKRTNPFLLDFARSRPQARS